MAEKWLVDGPRIIEVGGEDERVRTLQVAVVGGQVAVVTHDDSPVARVEVGSVEGPPVTVSWNAGVLRIVHGNFDDATTFMDTLRRLVDQPTRQRVELSVSVPSDVVVTASTVSAPIVASGLRSGITANTVSGELTLSDIAGPSRLNTVSGSAECVGLRGDARLNTVSGSLTVQASTIERASLNTVSGEIVLDLSNGRAEIASNSVSGDVTVRAPYTGYAVSATSASGQVVVDGQLMAKGGRRGPRRLNDGDESLRVKANSVSGNVVVLRAAGPTGPDGPQDAPASPSAGRASGGPQDAPVEPSSGDTRGPQDASTEPQTGERSAWQDGDGGQWS